MRALTMMRTGFEPVNAALRGRCVKPLHQRTGRRNFFLHANSYYTNVQMNSTDYFAASSSFLAAATRSAKPFSSWIAISDSIFLLTLMLASFRPCMNLL